MATAWNTVNTGPTLAQRMAAQEEAAKLKLAAEQAQATKLAAAKQKFKDTYKMSPEEYVTKAKLAAYGSSSEENDYEGRSRDGAWHTDKAPQNKVTKGDIKAYHDMEEAGKACARAGDIPGAIVKYDKAVELREAHEAKYGKAADTGHEGAKRMLRARRNSLMGLKNHLDETDPDVVAAKLVVKNFMEKEGFPAYAV